jgi:hypothetical protein
MILAPIGLKQLPWCIAYTSYVYRKAGVKLPKYFTSAWQLITWAEQNGKCVDDPLPGDLFALLHPKKPGDTQWKGHGGIVLAKDAEFLYNCEGNVKNAVRVGRRAIKPEIKFIRMIDNLPEGLTVPTGMMRIDGLTDR